MIAPVEHGPHQGFAQTSGNAGDEPATGGMCHLYIIPEHNRHYNA
jgi:hypothetical protein